MSLQSQPEQSAQRAKTLLRCVLFTFFVSGAAAQPLGSFVPFLREAYGLGYDVSGFFLSAQSLGNLLAVLAVGVLPLYLGRRTTVVLFAVWMSVGYLIFVSGIPYAPVLVAASLLTGIARGGNTNFANTMVSTLPGDQATRGYNLLHAAYAVGAILSPLLLIFCSNRWPATGWRVVGLALAALVAVQVVVYARMALPQEQFGRKGEKKAVDKSFFANRQFWMGALMLFFYISAEYAICGWMVTYFKDTGVLSADRAQMMNSFYWVVVFCGRMLGAWLTGKVSRAVMLLVDGVGVSVFFTLLFFSTTPLAVTLSMAGVGLFMATVYPTAFAWGSDCIKGNDLGCSIMIFTGSSGGILTPALVGWVAERAGIRAGMAVVVAATVLLLAVIVLSVLSARREAKCLDR